MSESNKSYYIDEGTWDKKINVKNVVAMATFSVPHPFNSIYNIFISSAPKGAECDSMWLWQVYDFLNQVFLQRFENFSLTADYSHFYEFTFYSPGTENVAMATKF